MGTFRPLSHEDLVFSERFIKLLTNFATDGKPALTMESGKKISVVESVQDFLIKLDMKPRMHEVKISVFSLNYVIIRLTKIMNNLLEHLKI